MKTKSDTHNKEGIFTNAQKMHFVIIFIIVYMVRILSIKDKIRFREAVYKFYKQFMCLT